MLGETLLDGDGIGHGVYGVEKKMIVKVKLPLSSIHEIKLSRGLGGLDGVPRCRHVACQ